jgi:trehalose utilization protein
MAHYPTYHHPDVQRVIANAVSWCARAGGAAPRYGHVPIPLETISVK